jgi:hypothetical protein
MLISPNLNFEQQKNGYKYYTTEAVIYFWIIHVFKNSVRTSLDTHTLILCYTYHTVNSIILKEAEWTPFQTHYFSENEVAPGIEFRPLGL